MSATFVSSSSQGGGRGAGAPRRRPGEGRGSSSSAASQVSASGPPSGGNDSNNNNNNSNNIPVYYERYDLDSFRRLLDSPRFKDDAVMTPAERKAYTASFRIASLLAASSPGGYRGVPVAYLSKEGGRYASAVSVHVPGLRGREGRHHSDIPTLATMRRDIRAVIAGADHWDIDFVNCQPTIMLQLLQKRGLSCPALERYVGNRDACLLSVCAAYGVSREAAKNLFVRLMFLGSVEVWARENDGAVPSPPQAGFVHDFAEQVRKAAELLTAGGAASSGHGDGPSEGFDDNALTHAHPAERRLASRLALFLQRHERACLDALRDAVERDGYRVAALIHDGLMIAKKDRQEPPISAETLRSWELHVTVTSSTGFELGLALKPLVPSVGGWLAPAPATAPVVPAYAAQTTTRDVLTDRCVMLSYHDMKELWERRVVKVVDTGTYLVLPLPLAPNANGTTARPSISYLSRSRLMDAYEHLHYCVLDSSGGDDFVSVKKEPFVRRWLADDDMIVYSAADTFPPPKPCPDNYLNLWDGFAVERFSPSKPIDEDSEGVRAFVNHIRLLVGATTTSEEPADDTVSPAPSDDAATDYVLDWIAQIFQQPGVKPGIALLLVGREGAGKNRLTDLLKLMVGQDRFLETANPAATLYGRFTEPRLGKFVVVVNEASPKDNHAANDLLKDMITAETFVCEAKGQNATTQHCFDRFIFCTNNANALRINPDSRRFVVFEVSSRMCGNTDYFRRLSAFIDDAHARREFHALLMRRGLSRRDWINDRPVTAHYRQMVQLNVEREYEFLRDEVLLPAYAAGKQTVKMQSSTLFCDFVSYLDKERNGGGSGSGGGYRATHKTFGQRLTALTRGQQAIEGVDKFNDAKGIVYCFRVEAVCTEMVRRMWMDADALVRTSALTMVNDGDDVDPLDRRGGADCETSQIRSSNFFLQLHRCASHERVTTKHR